MSAQIDPNGIPTSYYFEYGPSATYGSKTSEASAGSGTEPVTVSAQLAGLEPAEQYHFRVVAVNEAGSEPGAEATFATYASVPGLPDGRAYEMVTPVENHDAEVYEVGLGVL